MGVPAELFLAPTDAAVRQSAIQADDARPPP
jgi:hypothetical protein